jgi:hypothetical protein
MSACKIGNNSLFLIIPLYTSIKKGIEGKKKIIKATDNQKGSSFL